MQAAICCASVAPYAKKGHNPKISDFLFDFDKKPQTTDEMAVIAMGIPGLKWQQ